MRAVLLVASAALVLLLAGCPPRYTFGPEAYRDPTVLLEAVRRAESRPDSVTGEARLHVRTPQQSFGADHFVAARRPGDLRLETLSFFGNPLAIVVVHDGRLLLWDLGADRALEGRASAETLGTVAPVGLGPDEVVSILLGTPPLPSEGEVRLVLDTEARAYRLLLGSGTTREEVLVDPKTLTIREVDFFDGARRTGTLTYGRYRRAGRGLFPFEQRYEAADGAAVSVSWHDVTLDAGVTDALFEVTLPPHVRVEPFGAGAPPQVLPEEEGAAP